MGDRNNPIKFGPEWLRNLSREHAASRPNNSSSTNSVRPVAQQRPGGSANSTGTSQARSGASSPPTRSGGANQRPRGTSSGNSTGATGQAGASVTASASGINTRNSNTNVPRVQLASLRYGREEMLALYDRSVDAPDILKSLETLYQPRGKPPAALNSYDDDTRDCGRGVATAGPSGSFGRGRDVNNDGRVIKMRAPFVRHGPGGRGMSMTGGPRLPMSGNPRLPMYSGGDEEPTTSRAWSASNGAGATSRTPSEQTDWSKMFRRRQTHNTNWRQQTARDEDEWRQESRATTNRSNADKWDRDWADRPGQDRTAGWNANRRSRPGDDDNLPEWAVENAEGGGAGTFDASGAFHNDDSNVPNAEQQPFALTRSHTQGSFVPTKHSIEEKSNEWWEAEIKKASPKRYDAGDARFKRSQSACANETRSSKSQNEEQPDNSDNGMNLCEGNSESNEKFCDAQSFHDHDYNETPEDLGKFQSVMIPTNNTLRQKHQNMVTSSNDMPGGKGGNRDSASRQTPEEQIMDKYLDIPVQKVSKTMSNTQPQSSVSISSTSNPNTNLPMMINPAMLQDTNHGIPHNPPPAPVPIQNIGIPNSALNSTLGLPIGTGMQMQSMPSVMQNSQMNNMPNGPIGSSMHPRSIIGPYHNGIPVLQGPNPANSLFMGQSSAQQPNELAMNVSQNPMYPMLGLSNAQQVGFRSVYTNMPNAPNANNLAEQWFYEDPNKTIQGPFTSGDMYSWYRAGFFNSSLMVRRGCESHLRPLGSYGPIVPFLNVDLMSPFNLTGLESRPPAAHEMLNAPARGLEDTLWSNRPTTSRDLLWMQPPVNERNDNAVNNLPMFFWDEPTSAISSNSLLPEEIAKEMKTEDQILAQMRASQNIATPQPVQFLNNTQSPTTIVTSDEFANAVKATPDLEELQKLMENESLLSTVPDVKAETPEVKDKSNKSKIVGSAAEITKPAAPVQNKIAADTKPSKQAKAEADKAAKNKENAKTKTKKNKEDKREEAVQVKSKEEETRVEKRSAESSPTKCKKEDKPNKKELEREKKEWVKEGFTIVKGPEKSALKENKKKVEETRVAEEVERKKKEDEKLAADEDKKRRSQEIKKQQELQPKPLESLIKKAPWSVVATQAAAPTKDGLTLAEIQKLEREKKMEQMKEQQHMMQIIAQQQAAVVAREQEMQAVVGWAKKKSSANSLGQSLAEIQAETKRQSAAAAAAAAAAQAIEDAQAITAQAAAAAAAAASHAAWGVAQNGGGFWDTQPNPPPPKPEKPQEPAKPSESVKNKKKLSVTVVPNKKETTPAAEFEAWCNNALASWSYQIDVPTFVGFLKDIESPYEVKDYIKCYLDDSKDSNDFARQFLERRSKLLRVGMVTPSDDLCSPALAINPRNASGSDYQEVKSKGKKPKKNKMLKVDARILGFSVTASEDRINVGDIDTA